MKYETKDLVPLTIEGAKEYINPIVGDDGPVCNVLAWCDNDHVANQCQLLAVNKATEFAYITTRTTPTKGIVAGAFQYVAPIPEPKKVYWDAPRLMAWPGGYRWKDGNDRISRIFWSSEGCVVLSGSEAVFTREAFCDNFHAIDADGKAFDLWEVE